jgi:hypothetical protein
MSVRIKLGVVEWLDLRILQQSAFVHMGIVSNVDRFIGATVRQLRARLEGKDVLAGNWSLRELVDRLEQVGVLVSVENAQSSSVEK